LYLFDPVSFFTLLLSFHVLIVRVESFNIPGGGSDRSFVGGALEYIMGLPIPTALLIDTDKLSGMESGLTRGFAHALFDTTFTRRVN